MFDRSRVIFASLLTQTSVDENAYIEMEVLDELTQGVRGVTGEMSISIPVRDVQLISSLHTCKCRWEEGVICFVDEEPRSSSARLALMLAPARWTC